MYQEHHDFESPKNPKSKLWRYMDLSKLLSTLENSALYFTRSDKFEDPFEGTIPKAIFDDMSKYFTEFDNQEEMKSESVEIFEVNRKMTLINCWYQSEYESDAMWKLYSNNGIAIQTTFERLKDSVSNSNDKISIGTVKYIDYDMEGMFYLNAMSAFLFKRISFEHEREVRAVIWNIGENVNLLKEDEPVPIILVEHGKYSKINLDNLIEAIYVSPTAPKWFFQLVVSLITRYKIDKPVIHSTLYSNNSLINQSEENQNLEIKISKEILNHFYNKDSYRMNTENLKKERLAFREYESFLNDIIALDVELNKVPFSNSNNIKYQGKEALYHFSGIAFNREEAGNFFSKTQFKSLYFLNGKIDNILKEIKSSELSDKEKAILTKKTIYFYTENIMTPAINISLLIQKYNLKEEAYVAFMDCTFYMSSNINDLKI